jgi:hypothetical protein
LGLFALAVSLLDVWTAPLPVTDDVRGRALDDSRQLRQSLFGIPLVASLLPTAMSIDTNDNIDVKLTD